MQCLVWVPALLLWAERPPGRTTRRQSQKQYSQTYGIVFANQSTELFHCRVDGGSAEQYAIETNIAKASPVNDLSKFLGTIKVAYGI